MRTVGIIAVAAVAAAETAALAQTSAGPAAATAPGAPYRAGQLEIDRPWIVAGARRAGAVDVYLTIINRGAQPDRLVSASSIVARSVVSTAPLTIAAGAERTMAPGGEHLVMVEPARAFQVGEKAPLTLTFARAGRVTTEVDVLRTPPTAAAQAPTP
jgi:copper(I)-binding protein